MPPVHSFRRFALGALCASSLAAAEAPPPRDLSFRLTSIAEGRLEHVLRSADIDLAADPDNAALQDFRTRVAEAYEREWGARAYGATPPPVPMPVARLPVPSAQRAEPGLNFTVASAALPMVWIPPGKFVLGGVHGSDDDTQVTFSRGYWLGRTEVTQEQWRTISVDHPDPCLFEGSDRPVERISWTDAMEFARDLTARERAAGRLPADYEYSLPTEAQWEYACRAGATRSAIDDLGAVGWYKANSGGQTHPVAQLRPNAWGLYDMFGNVYEWCLDGSGGYPGGAVVDPLQPCDGPPQNSQHIVRGGAWTVPAGMCRPNLRLWRPVNATGGAVGFRLALVPRRTTPAPRPASGG